MTVAEIIQKAQEKARWEGLRFVLRFPGVKVEGAGAGLFVPDGSGFCCVFGALVLGTVRLPLNEPLHIYAAPIIGRSEAWAFWFLRGYDATKGCRRQELETPWGDPTCLDGYLAGITARDILAPEEE